MHLMGRILRNNSMTDKPQQVDVEQQVEKIGVHEKDNHSNID